MRASAMATLAFAIALGCKPTPRPAMDAAARAPARASSPLGWRCPAGARSCVDRAHLAAPFECAGNRCVQRHPVMPDDGDWNCGETAGVTLCTGGEVAAGVKPGGIAPGWICGSRRVGEDGTTSRVCLDASPDFPDGKAAGWRCFYESPALPNRVCVRDPGNHAVGDVCSSGHPCVDGALCRAGVCALPRRVPTCWLDADCGRGPCRFGNCPDDPVLAEAAAPIPPFAVDASRSARLDFGPPRPQVGFDAEFTLTVNVVSGPRPPRIRWRQIEGPALPELRMSEDGFEVRGRTPGWRTALGTSNPPWGVVPISRCTRGAMVFEASWDGSDGNAAQQTVVIAAAALSRGLTTVPVGARLYLGGDGWRVLRAPDQSQSRIEDHDGLAAFLPDVAGVWRLRDGKGRPLDLIAGRYEDVPLDCSRAGCHAEMLAGSLASPMTTVMARLLEGFPKRGPYLDRAAEYPGCALACHATGEPGTGDGGFHDLALAMNRTGHEHVPWPEMPRMLRRLGGAGCLSCHGPGAIPDPRASWSTLRSDVCATCHDALPVYRHMAAWRASANARADRDPDAAGKPECVGCHTTWGFLLAQKPKPDLATATANHLTFMASLKPPKQVGPIGIACAACHDPHPTVDGNGKTPHALLRKIARPAVLPALPAESARRSAICLPCHTPDPSQADAPFASAAAIWLGRGGLDPASGAALEGPAPFADLEGGCLFCHKGERDDSTVGGSHTFAARRQDCDKCPQQDPRRPGGIRQRAKQLYLDARLHRVLGDVHPVHASTAVIRRNNPAGRALWNLLLLLEDEAAEIHNPPYAKALLDSAESLLRSPTAARRLLKGRR